MSLNDRLEECARWCSAQPSGLVTLPADAVAAALWEASDDPGRLPWELIEWVRDPDHRANYRWSQACWDAAVPADKWDEYIRYDDPIRPQPTHDDCDGCGCPCHGRSASSADHRAGALQAIAAIRAEHPEHAHNCRTHWTIPRHCTCLLDTLDEIAADYQEVDR